MFRLNAITGLFVAAALGAGSATAQASSKDAPPNILKAAQNEVRNGRIVAAYLDRSITTSRVYRVIMDTPDWDRRLTIREDGVVLNKQRLYQPDSVQYARR